MEEPLRKQRLEREKQMPQIIDISCRRQFLYPLATQCPNQPPEKTCADTKVRYRALRDGIRKYLDR